MHQPLFLTRWIIWDRQEIIIRPKKILLFPEMRVTKKIFTWAAAKKSFFINLIDFFKWSLHLKNYSLSWKIKSPIFYFFKGKKRRFVRINLLVDFFVCVCVFFKQKTYILIHMTCGLVGDKKIFTQPISGNENTFFGLIYRVIYLLPFLLTVKRRIWQ